jgi:hypothetical protein
VNSWIVWGGFALAVVFLGWVAYHFTVRTLRFVTLALVVAGVVPVARYGVTHPPPSAPTAPVDLANAFTRGLDGLSSAFFQPLLPGPGSLVPGRAGWLVIAAFLVFAYRELEVWAMRWQPPAVDTSALDGGRPGAQDRDEQAESGDGRSEEQRARDRLMAELRFRLPAVEVRAPALVPGGSTPNGLASVAENSDVAGGGLAGAIIRVAGMLWPSPRRYQVRVWVRCAGQPASENRAGMNHQGGPPRTASSAANDQRTASSAANDQRTASSAANDQRTASSAANDQRPAVTRMWMTVDLEDAQTGGSVATKTLAALDVDDAAARVAGYVARQIFRADPTTPPWSVGSFDGSDLAALISAKQRVELIHCPQDAHDVRCSQIHKLKNAVPNSPGAGVARYELALLYDLEGYHAEALKLHALNRRQYPGFFRGRYRLGMSLEMLANPLFVLDEDKDIEPFRDSLRILDHCSVTCDAEAEYADSALLSCQLRGKLLAAARAELRKGRRRLTLWRIIWATFWHRDERPVLKPYWRLRERQRPHDAARVAELLVTVRQCLNEQERDCTREGLRRARKYRRHTKRALHIVAAITGDVKEIKETLNPGKQGKNAGKTRWRLWQRRTPSWEKWRPTENAGKTRWLFWQRRTPSWQAAYNAACLYAALGGSDRARGDMGRQDKMVRMAVRCLRRAVNDRRCEMERPWEWISTDPDLRCLRCGCSPAFSEFLAEQKRKDYPEAAPDPEQNWQWVRCDGGWTCGPDATMPGNSARHDEHDRIHAHRPPSTREYENRERGRIRTRSEPSNGHHDETGKVG